MRKEKNSNLVGVRRSGDQLVLPLRRARCSCHIQFGDEFTEAKNLEHNSQQQKRRKFQFAFETAQRSTKIEEEEGKKGEKEMTKMKKAEE